jgi:triosephosphate isomerase (TIM)
VKPATQGSGRRPLVAGNWKLHKTLADTSALLDDLLGRLDLESLEQVEVVVAPVFTALSTAQQKLAGRAVGLAAQDCYDQPQGAFTGEVSVPLLADVGCRFVIVGHSERRELFGETDDQVKRKVLAVLKGGLTPIACVGETLAIREAGNTERHVLAQVDAIIDGLETVEEPLRAKTVIAYEPVWAIGTGRTATPADAQAVHAAIRRRLTERLGPALSDGTRILYGGSVKADNAAALMAEPDIDGALVGGASLDAATFAAIVRAAQ